MTLNDVGALVNKWALRQSDNWDHETSPGAHPDMSYNLIEPIARYVLDNDLLIDPAGFETAYQSVIAGYEPPHKQPDPVTRGAYRLPIMTGEDWLYLIKRVEEHGWNAGLVMQSTFSDPYADCQAAFDTFHNNHTAEVSQYNVNDYPADGFLRNFL